MNEYFLDDALEMISAQISFWTIDFDLPRLDDDALFDISIVVANAIGLNKSTEQIEPLSTFGEEGTFGSYDN